jgi:serine/threonine-protein kinase
MDFGIAKAEGTSLTRAGFTLGTPYYMAPEQVLGQPLTPQADVYSFGVLLFELLSGTRPVTGDAVESIFNQILYEPVNLAPLQALHLPASVTELIERCTAKPPAQRPHGLGAVADAIEEILDPPRVSTKLQPRAPAPSPKAAALRKPSRAARPDEFPRFLEMLPASLRTDTGLMLLAAGIAFVLVMLVYLIVSRSIH